MALFGSSNADINDIKKQMEESHIRLKDLEEEMKVLRREIEFLKNICKRNEVMILEHGHGKSK